MNTVSRSPKTLKKHENVFQIEWKDGHASWYPYTYLRQMCPCAECAIIRHKGKDITFTILTTRDGDVTLIEVSENIQPTDIQLVGRYALQFSWTDGHNTGIYPFEVLRETCPCQNVHQYNEMKTRMKLNNADKTFTPRNFTTRT